MFEDDLSSDGDEEGDSSGESRLDLADRDLESVQRGVMARTKQKYLSMEASSLPDRLFTAFLIILTMVAILVLFWFQNFGPGFHSKH